MNKTTINDIVLSPDTGLALLISLLVYGWLPQEIQNEFAKEIYFAGLLSLSVTFAIYFAGHAIIVSSSQDKFIIWLEDAGDIYTNLVNLQRFTLCSLMVAYLLAFILYVWTSYQLQVEVDKQSKYYFVLFVSLASYAIFAALLSVFGSIRYTKERVRYLKFQKEQEALDKFGEEFQREEELK